MLKETEASIKIIKIKRHASSNRVSILLDNVWVHFERQKQLLLANFRIKSRITDETFQ
jgi:hypothetical protein